MGEGKGGGAATGGWTPPPDGSIPPGFESQGDPSGVGTPFVNQATGQSIHWGGTQWVNDATGGPFTHAHDPETGATAYQNPKTGGWEHHVPPKWFVVDDSVPPDQLGFHYIALDGQRIHYDAHQGDWVDEATGRALPPRTEEKPGTGDEAGKVDVPEPDPGYVPHEDTPEEALAKNSIASSRLKALQRGDDSVPHGTVAKDYAADLQNLSQSVALLQQMQAAGASPSEIRIVVGHISDLLTYLELWNSKGGATAVNAQAQLDDLKAQVEQTTAILEIGLETAGGEAGGHLGKFIDAKGIGGGGSQTVVPKHRTAKSYLGGGAPGSTSAPTGPASSQGKTQPLPPPDKGPATQQAKTQTLPGVEPAPASAQAKTQPLPGVEPAPASAQAKTQPLPGEKGGAKAGGPGAPEKTEVGRPSKSELDDAQLAARAREQAADKAAQKSGFKDYEEMQVKLNEQRLRKQAFENVEGDPTLYGQRVGEKPAVTADRFGKQGSLGGTKYDPSTAAVNMKGARKDLENIVAGRSDIPATEKNVQIRYRDYEAAQQAVREGQAKYKDYDERIPWDAKSLLQRELDAAKGKNLDYWKSQLGGQGKGGAAGPAGYQETPIAPPSLPSPIGMGEPPRPRLGGTTGILAVLAVGLIVVAGLVLNLGSQPAGSAAPSGAAAASASAPATSVGGPVAAPACRSASLLQDFVHNVTQAVLTAICANRMPDGIDDGVEYNGTPAKLKPGVGDLVAVADPLIELSEADAAALKGTCRFSPPPDATPGPASPAGPLAAGLYCAGAGPAAGKYEVYAMELATPFAINPAALWEAGVGFTTGSGATWDGAKADPLTGHNAYLTIRFSGQGVFGPISGAWGGQQGTFFMERPTAAFAAIDGELLLMFVPATEWTGNEGCRWFTFFGMSDGSGGSVDLWPEAGEPGVSCRAA